MPRPKGWHHSQDAKDKIGIASLGRNVGKPPPNKGKRSSQLTRDKLSASHSGKVLSQVHKDAIAISMQGKQNTKGRKLTQSHKDKIGVASKARKRNPHTLVAKFKIGGASKNAWENKTEEQKAEKIKQLHSGLSYVSKPEDLLAGILTSKGRTFERQKWIGKYCVDFYFPDTNKIIEVYGCYWHQCEQCGFIDGTWVKKNKFLSYNEVHMKDQYRRSQLENLGYMVTVIWEHSLVRK